MTQTVRHMGYGITLNLSLDDLGHPDRPGLWEEIYRQDVFDRGLLRCAVVENGTHCPEAMYVQIRDGRRIAAHCSLDAAPHAVGLESPLHKALKDRVADSASRSGLTVSMEDPSADRSRITDLLVTGSTGKPIGWEFQLSGISPQRIIERSSIAHRDGITPLWTVTNPSAAPINRAPWARLDQFADWRMVNNSHLAVRGGVRKLEMRDCDFTWFERCPQYSRGGARFCGRRHPRLEVNSVQLDDLIVWSAEGVYVPLFVAAKAASNGAYMWVTANDKLEFLQGRPEELPYATPVSAGQAELAPIGEPKPLDLACHYGEQSDVRRVRAARDTSDAIVAPMGAPVDPARRPSVGSVRPRVEARATQCNWSCCGATENLTLFAGGRRCPEHTPAAIKRQPEPAELLRIGRETAGRRFE